MGNRQLTTDNGNEGMLRGAQVGSWETTGTSVLFLSLLAIPEDTEKNAIMAL